ncbi:MAG: hypothetical protein HUJ28_11740 [Chromatiales bacterium]|nr:hypothetical protein [Chromatiales bacterium]
MAEIFTVTSPLMIKSPHGGEKVIAELFPHPDGILFFEIFWDQMEANDGIYVIKGELKGEGPWKVGDYIINLLGCQGTNPDLAEDFSQWQMYLQSPLSDYPSEASRLALAREHGASI